MNKLSSTPPIIPTFLWDEIDTVLLDMDGTLLDSYFDDYFWEEYVPRNFAEVNNISPEEARKTLLSRYRSVEKTLQWADLDFWSEQLGLDIPELKCKIDHLIQVHPYVIDFLKFITSQDKQLHLVTAAHSKTLKLKLGKTAIGPYFDRIIPAEEIGVAKESPQFWDILQQALGFSTDRTLLVDDNSNVLQAAQHYGIEHLVYVAKPSSRRPVKYSEDFPSIVFFKDLIF
ncbi:HAD-IA family hydrolase [Desulfosediminicola flagellatus]|uniref:HAD-IA family hydrolase n=1 Tax=Desulfosediminicola flagellatus TaxID=2569541 RepID=UPI0010AC0941|nr:HAD-IA family hydrolase [Desulfosediminicola flagellatus]